MIRQGLALTAIGLTLGMLGAAGLTRSLTGMLYALTALYPTAYVAVAIVFGCAATFAAYSLPTARHGSTWS